MFDEAIETALRAAKAVVVLWSPESVVSRWVRAEATVADNDNTLVPVMIRACRRPVIFELSQTAELSHWKGNRKDPAWRALVDDVRRLVSGETHRQRASTIGSGGTRIGFGERIDRLRYPLLAGFAAIVLLAGGAVWWNFRGDAGDNPPLRIAPFQAEDGPQAAQFAQALRDNVINVMGQSSFPITTDASSIGSRAGMVLNASVLQAGADLKVLAQLQDSGSGIALWSRQFEGSAADSDRLSSAIAVAAAEPLYEMREVNLQKGLRLAPGDMAQLLKSTQLIDNPRLLDEGMLRRVYEDAIAQTSNVAYTHGNLAVALVQDAARSEADQRPALFDRSRTEANAAFKISPAASGGGYDALYLMSVYQEPGNIAHQEQLLLNGLRNAPGFPYLTMRECQFLMSVGRNEDAWSYCQHAHAMRPLTAPIEWRLAEALKMRGEPAEAEQAIEQAAHDHPDNPLVRLANFDILTLGGSYDRALALLPAMLNQSESFGDAEIDALKSYLLARKSGTAAAVDRAAAALRSAVIDHNLRLDVAVDALASLGRIDDAFAVLDTVSAPLPPQMDLAPANAGTAFLFAPETASLRADPRFWTIARRQGLTSYWIGSGRWPDFCGKEMPLAKCKALAAAAPSTAS